MIQSSSMLLAQTKATAAATPAPSPVPASQLTNSQAQTILKNKPFTPTDINLFRSQTYTGAAVYQPAAAPRTPETTAQLKSFVGSKMAQVYMAMNPKLSKSAANTQAESAASLIDNAQLKKYVPDPRLRAAVAMLKGTAADGAIQAIENGAFKNIVFASDSIDANNGTNSAMAYSQTQPDGSQVIKVNSRYANEDPRELASLLAHEVSHQDGVNSVPEEQTAYSLESMVYGQYVLADPSLPLQKTELTQRRNMELLARMNDRDANTGNLRILSANGSTLYPGGKVTLPNFASAVTATDPGTAEATTPGNAYLRSVVKNLTGKDLGPNIGYNSTTLKAIDSSQTLFTLQQLIQIDRNLKLNVPAK